MSYQVLARKWRPRNFGEMAGQGHVLKTLIHALSSQRLHHAYLFTGTRGVGKTTIARILAKCLNCEQGVSAEPCGDCGACREIDQGRFIDLIEVDAASRTKVEDTRELLDNVQYAPSRGRYKVYLIDEVHMLSGHSFNALLKTLEEPPPHVKFLLATTDPQKLPVTVLSRCLQFNLKNLSPEQLVVHLRHVLEQEGIPFEEAALWQVGRAARGSARDALTLLDQAIPFCEGKLSDAGLRALLGTLDTGVILGLLDSLAARDGAALLAQVAAAAEHGADFSAVLEGLLSTLHRITIAQVVPAALDNSQGDRESIQALAAALPAETVQLYYQIALKGREDLPLALDPRSGLEMTLLRMLAFTPGAPPRRLEGGLEAGRGEAEEQKKKSVLSPSEAAVAVSVPSSPDAAPRSAARPAPEASLPPVPRPIPQPARPPAEPGVVPARPPLRVAEVPPAGRSEALAEDSGPALENAASRPQIALEDLEPEHWIALFEALGLRGITRNIAANCVLQSVSGRGLVLVLDDSQASLYNDEQRRRIQDALSGYFGRELALRVEISPELAGETPAAWRRRMEQERLQRAIDEFENDAVVRELLERFSGSIQPGSIEALTPPSPTPSTHTEVNKP